MQEERERCAGGGGVQKEREVCRRRERCAGGGGGEVCRRREMCKRRRYGKIS